MDTFSLRTHIPKLLLTVAYVNQNLKKKKNGIHCSRDLLTETEVVNNNSHSLFLGIRLNAKHFITVVYLVFIIVLWVRLIKINLQKKIKKKSSELWGNFPKVIQQWKSGDLKLGCSVPQIPTFNYLALCSS